MTDKGKCNNCGGCGACRRPVTIGDGIPETSVVITLRITPGTGSRSWGSRTVGGIAKGLVSFAKDWCENNNRDALIEGTWAIYEGGQE